MKQNMYSIFDSKSKVYSAPFLALNDEVAKRMLLSTLMDGDTNVAKFPQDYILFLVGNFSDSSVKIEENGNNEYDQPIVGCTPKVVVGAWELEVPKSENVDMFDSEVFDYGCEAD